MPLALVAGAATAAAAVDFDAISRRSLRSGNPRSGPDNGSVASIERNDRS